MYGRVPKIEHLTYDPCAHQGCAHLHQNQEYKSQVEPATDKALLSPTTQKLMHDIPNQQIVNDRKA